MHYIIFFVTFFWYNRLYTCWESILTIHKSQSERLQEDFSLLRSQLRQTVQQTIIKAEDLKKSEGKVPEFLENATVSDVAPLVGEKMLGSTKALEYIKTKIDPILSRVETSLKKVEKNEFMTAEEVGKVIEEANDAVGKLVDIKNDGIEYELDYKDYTNEVAIAKKAKGYYKPLQSEAEGLINLLKNSLGSLKEKAIQGIKDYKKKIPEIKRGGLDDYYGVYKRTEKRVDEVLKKVKQGAVQENISFRPSDYVSILKHDLNLGVMTLGREQGLSSVHTNGLNVVGPITVLEDNANSGVFNSVKRCKYFTYQDGKLVEKIGMFKPGLSADMGLSRSGAALILKYDESNKIQMQTALKNNIAANYIANKLGTSGTVTKSSFAVVNGEYGILMEFADGTCADDFYLAFQEKNFKRMDYDKYLANLKANARPKLPNQDMIMKMLDVKSKLPGATEDMSKNVFKNMTEYVKLNKQDRITMNGELMRELNKLQWNDILSGQVDRHAQNFYVAFDCENKKVNVKGIDNDVCCGRKMIGMQKLQISNESYNEVISANRDLLDDDKIKGFYVDKENNAVVVKFAELTPNAYVACCREFGFKNPQLPYVIDSEMYEKLMSINKDEYRAEMTKILGDKASVNAAVGRLTEAQKYAESLGEKGVVKADEWHKAEKQDEIIKLQKEKIKNCAKVENLTSNDIAGYSNQYLSTFSFMIDYRDNIGGLLKEPVLK